MSDTAIVLIVIFITSFLFVSGIAWYLLVFIPKNVHTVVTETTRTIKDGFGFTPKVTINNTVFYKQTQEILELALDEQTIDVEHESRDTWMWSEKLVITQGIYKAKIGFDLTKGFRVEVKRGNGLKPTKLAIHLPCAEVLSVQEEKVRLIEQSGYIYWVNEEDKKNARKSLTELAKSSARKPELLTQAQDKIENRLADILLPILNLYSVNYEVNFFESADPTPVVGKNDVISIPTESTAEIQDDTPSPNDTLPEMEISEMKIINFYDLEKEYGCFSNFARYPIKIWGKEWPTSEHYFQAQKFARTDKRYAAAIRKAKSSRDALNMGRDQNKRRRPDWDIVKDDIMRQAVRAKFTQHAELQEILLNTGEALLVEHTENDSYWGDGGDRRGKNMLGKILMEVRQELREPPTQPQTIAMKIQRLLDSTSR